MITLSGAVHKSFLFPAEIRTACAYFSDYDRILSYLPHIGLVKTFAPNQFRMLYHTTELGLYRVSLYCDLETNFDKRKRVLSVTPFNHHAPVRSRVTMNSLTAQGTYTSESTFRAAGHHTRVDYHLRLEAQLPKPLGLRVVPDRVLEKVAHDIAVWRIREIADGFIERALKEFARGRRPLVMRHPGR